MKEWLIVIFIMVICLVGVTMFYNSFRWCLDAKTITLFDVNTKEFVNGKNKLGFEIIFPVQISDIQGYSSGGTNQSNIRIVDKENRIYSIRTGFGGSHLIDEDIEKCISLQDKIQVNLYLKNRIIKTIKLENASSKSKWSSHNTEYPEFSPQKPLRELRMIPIMLERQDKLGTSGKVKSDLL